MDKPLTNSEMAALSALGYQHAGGQVVDGVLLPSYRKDGVRLTHTRAEWRAIIDRAGHDLEHPAAMLRELRQRVRLYRDAVAAQRLASEAADLVLTLQERVLAPHNVSQHSLRLLRIQLHALNRYQRRKRVADVASAELRADYPDDFKEPNDAQ